MSLVHCDGIALAYGTDVVLSAVELRLEARERLAVVGANGAGKTSLLDIIAGVIEPTGGSVERQRRLRIGYLPQDAPEPVAESLLDEVMASRDDLVRMHAEMSGLEQAMSGEGDELAATLARYGDVQH